MSLVSLAEALIEGPESKLAQFTIEGQNEQGGTVPGLEARALQFYPETINDAYSPQWIDKQIPGGSHPLKQWVSNAGRTINFQVILSRDILPVDLLPAVAAFSQVNPQAEVNKPFNRDIRDDIAFLRAFCYPTYGVDDSSGVTLAQAPPVALLNAPGLGWGIDGLDTIVAVMTACTVNYLRLFEEGFPRLATVDLAFSEIVQTNGAVTFHDRATLMAAPFFGAPDTIG